MDFSDLATEGKPARTPAARNERRVLLPRPKRRNVRWCIIGVISLVVVSNYLDRGNLSVAAPLIMHDLSISNTSMGLMLSAFVWPYALMNLPAGWMIDRFGPKLLLSIAIGLWSIVSILTGFARSIGEFLTLRVALGICTCACACACSEITSDLTRG